jgi:protein PhnA
MEAAADSVGETAIPDSAVKDAFGNLLVTGDSVTVIKDLKVKGASSVVKVGTKVRQIRIVESSDGHNIACKIDGIGALNLKSEFVKKA